MVTALPLLAQELMAHSPEALAAECARLTRENGQLRRMVEVYAHVPVSIAAHYRAQAIKVDPSLSEPERDVLIARNALAVA